MLFNALPFFLFLPLALAAFTLTPPTWRWLVMLAASAVFYGYEDPTAPLYPAAVAIFAWATGRVMEIGGGAARRAVLALGLSVLVGSLALFKFGDFLLAEAGRALGMPMEAVPALGIAAPPGYSFYTFAASAYIVDVFRRDVAAAGLRTTAIWLAWFPKLVAGPIERAGPFFAQLEMRAPPDEAMIVAGLQLVLWGLVKKVVVADNLAPLVDRTFAIPAFAAPMELLVAVYFFAFQIYCDFSGYTDIAIGVSLLFGFRLAENFRRPYLSRSTAEFWASRWHISLGRWFRDYLYIPLGGSRVGPVRRAFNVMAVFLASGLWHAGLGYGVGWTFLVWGALNGFYQWTGMLLAPIRRRAAAAVPRLAASGFVALLQGLATFHLIALAWIFFRAETLGDAWTIIARLAAALRSLPALLPAYPFTSEHAIGAALIAALLAIEILAERRPWGERLAAVPAAIRWPVYYAGLFALLVLGQWQLRQFIYMQF